MAGVTDNTKLDLAVIWAHKTRHTMQPLYNGADEPKKQFTCRFVPWKQPANNKYMYIGSGETLIEATRNAMYCVAKNMQVPLNWSARTYEEAAVPGGTDKPVPELPF